MNVIETNLNYHFEEGAFSEYRQRPREENFEAIIAQSKMPLKERMDLDDIINSWTTSAKEDGYKQGFKDAFDLFISLQSKSN